MKQLPIPAFFDKKNADKIYMIDYENIVKFGYQARKRLGVPTIAADYRRGKVVTAMFIDNQNTFTIPNAQLFVGGRSGRAAVDDSVRAAEFVYREAANITNLVLTMDTHKYMQIFHAAMLVNSRGEHPVPYTRVSVADIESGVWKADPEFADALFEGSISELQNYILHYVRTLKKKGRYELTIWPYHAALGGASHPITAVLEEAVWYHSALRGAQPDFRVKGGKALTESYSAIGPEVTTDAYGRPIAQRETKFVETLIMSDRLIIAGQAKSHCVAWTIDDVLSDIKFKDESLARKIYLLEDCTSPVVVPGVVDYTDDANAAFERFAQAGMNIVKSTTPMEQWPGF